MTAETITSAATPPAADVDLVRAGFHAVAAGDLPGFAAMFHPDATWNHRNDDRLGGVKAGVDEIVEFLRESMELTAGTLRPVAEILMPDGAGHVAVLTRITATRPDRRAFDDRQILLFALEQGRFEPLTSSLVTQPQEPPSGPEPSPRRKAGIRCAQQRCRTNPCVHVGVAQSSGEVPVHPHRPLLARTARGAGPPRLGDSVQSAMTIPPQSRRSLLPYPTPDL